MNWRVLCRRAAIAGWAAVFVWFAYGFIGIALADYQPNDATFTITRIATSVGLTAFLCWGFCKITLAIIGKPKP